MIAYEVKVSVFKYFFRHENIQFAFEANSIKFEMPTHFSSSVFFFSFSCIGLIYTKQHSTFWSNVHYRQPFSSLRKRVFFSAGIFCRGCVLNIILVMKHHFCICTFLCLVVIKCIEISKKYFDDVSKISVQKFENWIVLFVFYREFFKSIGISNQKKCV